MVRAFANGAMGRLVDPSWWIHLVISRSSQCCGMIHINSERVAHVTAAGFLSRHITVNQMC